MSKVEMELSEYNQMQDYKRSLETTNLKLKEVYEENKQLLKEKAVLLKKNENTVTIIKRTETRKQVHMSNHGHDIIRRLEDLLYRVKTRLGSPDPYRNPLTGYVNYTLDGDDWAKQIFGCLYTFSDIPQVSSGEDTEVYSESLKDYHHKMRREVTKSIDEDTKTKLALTAEYFKKLNVLEAEHTQLQKVYNDELEMHTKEIQDWRETEDHFIKNHREISDKHESLKNQFDMFNWKHRESLQLAREIKDMTSNPSSWGAKDKLKEIHALSIDVIEIERQQNDT